MNEDPTAQLRAKLAAAYDAIADHISRRLGYGPLSGAPPGLKDRIDQEVADALAEWRVAEHRSPEPRFALQRLLRAFRSIELEIQGRSPKKPDQDS